ncbi:hypothetical protein MAIC_23470 [Mycolicibacterium aichiense]|uniref:Uncharacterized protein n=1 Tax=Mycolicibacterium aichiense TaxID=1799 RepID=A0AAD1HM84_9MYCO|nr:hypothetical protein MAIC_23470 [Mycolicibacterium aichiense]
MSGLWRTARQWRTCRWRRIFRPAREYLRAATEQADGCPDTCPNKVILCHILRLCTGKQGVGLDFVRERGYGRRRWLKYPAQAKQ